VRVNDNSERHYLTSPLKRGNEGDFRTDYMEPDIQKALEILRAGGVILYPTDTVWGVGCDATNEEAVSKIFKIKKRSEAKSLIVLVGNENQLSRYVKDIPEVAWELMENTERPLTIIYDTVTGLAPSVIANDGSVGIRIVKDEFCQNLIKKLGKPIVSTSANISNEPSPSNFDEIADELKEQVDYVVNWRQEEIKKNQPSVIIKLALNGEFKIIRN
jgi:L-threonylcarbamoyladenylate synthase